MLSNQLRILQLLEPSKAEHYAQAREVFERGYEYEYYDYIEICGDPEVLGRSSCQFVRSAHNMFSAADSGYQALADKSGIDETLLQFIGFDPVNEKDYLAYSRFVRFGRSEPDQSSSEDVISWTPTIQMYERMVKAWNESEEMYELIKNDLIRIATARISEDESARLIL